MSKTRCFDLENQTLRFCNISKRCVSAYLKILGAISFFYNALLHGFLKAIHD